MKKTQFVLPFLKSSIRSFRECHDMHTCVKFILCFCIFVLISCLSLYAGEGLIYYGDAKVYGKEHIFVKSATAEETTSQSHTIQPEISPSNSSYIYIAEDALIYGKEHLIVKQKNCRNEQQKNISKTVKEAPSPAKDEIPEEAPVVIIPELPFLPSSYFQSGKESAIAISQPKPGRDQPVCKANRRNIYPDIENLNLSLYIPRQRQKLSTAAIQCGILTSFSPNSPTFS